MFEFRCSMCSCCEGSHHTPGHSAAKQIKLENGGNTLQVSDNSFFDQDKLKNHEIVHVVFQYLSSSR